MSYFIHLVLLIAVWLAPLSQADAQIASLLRKGVTVVGKKLGIVGRETVEESTKRIAVRSSVASGSKKLVSTGGMPLASSLTVKPVVVSGIGAAEKMRPVLIRELTEKLGKGSAQALQKLSLKGLDDLAKVSGELAKSPHRNQWMNMLATYGDDCASFLSKRAGSVAVLAGATAVVVCPDDFLKAGEKVFTTTVEAVGSHLIEPLVTGATEKVVAPVVKEVSANAISAFPWGLFWSFLGVGLFGGAGYWLFRS